MVEPLDYATPAPPAAPQNSWRLVVIPLLFTVVGFVSLYVSFDITVRYSGRLNDLPFWLVAGPMGLMPVAWVLHFILVPVQYGAYGAMWMSMNEWRARLIMSLIHLVTGVLAWLLQ